MKTLSSYATLAYKTLLPGVFIGLSFLGGYTMLDTREPTRLHAGAGQLISGFLPVLVVTAIVVPLALRIKVVDLIGDELQVTNYFKRCVVPIRAIVRVSEIKFLRPPLVTLHLAVDTAFGDKIVFIPRGTGWRRRVSVADQLREHLARLPAPRE